MLAGSGTLNVGFAGVHSYLLLGQASEFLIRCFEDLLEQWAFYLRYSHGPSLWSSCYGCPWIYKAIGQFIFANSIGNTYSWGGDKQIELINIQNKAQCHPSILSIMQTSLSRPKWSCGLAMFSADKSFLVSMVIQKCGSEYYLFPENLRNSYDLKGLRILSSNSSPTPSSPFSQEEEGMGRFWTFHFPSEPDSSYDLMFFWFSLGINAS